ncbi:MAG: hypothetical protein CR997_10025 [Acidobacteria bacterium]|nr:MAG: hypothetical protein CR997_10025 [Acidobacteriota bacterium]
MLMQPNEIAIILLPRWRFGMTMENSERDRFLRESVILDGHCHLSLHFDRAYLATELSNATANAFFLGGYEPVEWQAQLQLRKTFPGYHWLHSFGLHPWWVASHSSQSCEAAFAVLEKQVQSAHAVGECGLDYSSGYIGSRKHQELWFIRQLHLAVQVEKPVVLHLVRSYEAALRILDDCGLKTCRGMVHGFSGSREVAEAFIRRGWLISFGPNIMKRGYKKMKRTLKTIPSEYMVIETDSMPIEALRDGDEQGGEGQSEGLEPSRFRRFVPLKAVARAVSAYRSESWRELLELSKTNLCGLLFN